MSQSADATTEPREISTEEFDQLLEEQKEFDTKKWADLEIKKIYTITDYKTIKLKDDESVVVNLLNYGEVWCPPHLYIKIKDFEPPFYVRPLGLKPCKENKKINKYHAYDLVIPKRSKSLKSQDYMHEDYVKSA